MLKRPSCQYGQVNLNLSCMTRVVLLTGKLFDYLTSHFDYSVMDHLTQFFLGLLQKIKFV
jgi:hypothetical protein